MTLAVLGLLFVGSTVLDEIHLTRADFPEVRSLEIEVEETGLDLCRCSIDFDP